MKKKSLFAVFLVLGIIIGLMNFTIAENLTSNESIITGQVVSDNSTINQTVNDSVVNQTVEIPVQIYQPEISIISITPKEFKIGDNQFNIQVQNNKNVSLKNIALLVTGKGFSINDVVPIESLDAKEKGYVLILGNFREAGNLTLKIQRTEDVFYYNVSVIDANSGRSQELQQQQDSAALIQNYSVQLNSLKQNYSELENLISQKKDDNYDLSKVSLDDLKKYIRTTQSALLTGDMNSAKVNLNLGFDEYADQKAKIEGAKTVPFLNRIKDNLALVGAIAASILTLFTFYELIKKKKKEVSETIASRIKPKEDKKKKK